MSGALPAEWVARLQARLQRPPARPRVPLLWQGRRIGTVEPDLPARVPAAGLWAERIEGVHLEVPDLPSALAQLALALRDAGVAHAWRDELLAVRDLATGELLAGIERAVVRPLGIPTQAVHLVGWAPDGRQWLQQRAFDKANDPGMWDTLVGGMVPASDTLAQALERETWEEAGLRLPELQGLQHGGQVVITRPLPEGYMVEALDWWRVVVPQGIEPVNQDGEVARFLAAPPDEVRALLLADAFTLEASAVLAAGGLDAP